jgi:hypothetical protein
MTIEFNHHHPVRFLLWAVALLVAIHIAVGVVIAYGIESFWGFSTTTLSNIFNLGVESNVPTWFSSMILFLAALLLGICSVACRTKHPREVNYWRSLAILFVYISIDEAARLHETMSDWIARQYHLAGVFYYPWVLPFSGLVLICVLLYTRFLFRLSPSVRTILIASAVVYVTGALGLELFEGIYRHDRWVYAILVTIEETLEMVGVVLLIHGLLTYLKEEANNIRILIV